MLISVSRILCALTEKGPHTLPVVDTRLQYCTIHSRVFKRMSSPNLSGPRIHSGIATSPPALPILLEVKTGVPHVLEQVECLLVLLRTSGG